MRLVEEIRKALVSFLGKLNMPESEDVEEWKIKCVALLCANIKSVSHAACLALDTS